MSEEPIKPIEYDKERGIYKFHLASTVANDDWLRAGRLKEQARNGDKDAKEELEQIEEEETYLLKDQ